MSLAFFLKPLFEELTDFAPVAAFYDEEERRQKQKKKKKYSRKIRKIVKRIKETVPAAEEMPQELLLELYQAAEPKSYELEFLLNDLEKRLQLYVQFQNMLAEQAAYEQAQREIERQIEVANAYLEAVRLDQEENDELMLIGLFIHNMH